jgi:hypothetical protein
MKPRKISRSFGCPPVLWFDDPEKFHHYTGRSVDTIERWASDGLRIHSMTRGGREYKYVLIDEFLAFMAAVEGPSRTFRSAA